MLGLMQQHPLLISSIITFADRHHGDTEIVSVTIEGALDKTGAKHRYTYREAHARAKRLANVLGTLGVASDDRVGTLAWNGYRHFELYFGVSGMGAILHTVNPRLFPDQITWIVNHAEDKVLFFDLTFVGLVEKLAPHLNCKIFVLMTDEAHMPSNTSIPNLLCYETLLNAASPHFEWPQFDENTASSMCYTSGTTGNPKGALYTHRSTVLHVYGAALPDAMCLSARDTVMPVVPMFHANAWSLAYACPAVGAKMVLPGMNLDGKSVYQLMESEQVTFSAGVPTVWLGLLQHIENNHLQFSSLKRTVIGGSACPPAIINTFKDKFNVDVLHAWGMTEMSPLGTVGTLKAKHNALPIKSQREKLYKQGRAIFGVDMKIVDAGGEELAWDGKIFGDLHVKGPWVTSGYFKRDDENALIDGWFATGDVATIDEDGFMQITDRSKDVIKSGGEWISSIDIENLAMAHPAVAEAACIAVAHAKWDERPLLIVVKKAGQTTSREELLAFFNDKVAKWWIPDDVIFVTELPHTATGKLQKLKLREQYKNYLLQVPS
jgi:fatty-acyl-CoA synthase